jgi:hypothetical protein
MEIPVGADRQTYRQTYRENTAIKNVRTPDYSTECLQGNKLF